ncbi:hypothetical protein EJD97_025238 [Solanum chilense]|uniref:Uncharacterized protein n=1 Tax=Solanum chilense TaxID=4083 RepID=A0A6N2C0J4_SOLCI|nr:hypothetical protein EJD97_025238 [Solanum chilense]
MAQTKVVTILTYLLFFSILFSHIIQSIEGRFMKFKHISGPSSHTMVSKMQDWRVKDRDENPNVVYATKKGTFDDEPAPMAPPSSVPPPGSVDGFSPYGRGHSPGIGHSIQN